MALTPERKAQLDAMIAKQKAASTKTAPKKEEPGFLASVAKDIASPFLKTGTSVANAIETTANLGAAGLSGIFGTKEQTRKLLSDAAESIGKRRDFGVLGTAVPVGYSQETGKVATLGQSVKDIVGTGAELGSYFVGGEGAKNVAKLGFGGLVKKGAVEGLTTGLFTGAAQMGGKEMQSPTSTFGSVAGKTLLGGAGGALIGGPLGAAVPAVGAAVSPLLKFGAKAAGKVPAILKAGPELVAHGAEWLKRGAQKIERGVEEKAAEAVLPAFEKSAVRSGVGPEVLERIKTASPETQGGMRKMIAAAKESMTNIRSRTRPIEVAGQSLVDRASFVSKSLKETGKALGALKSKLRGIPVDTADLQSAIASDLSDIGLSVSDEGKLVSAVPVESDLSGVVSDIYNFIGKNNTMDASDVDRMRQYLFDPNTSAGVPLRGRAQAFAEKYRELLLKKLSEIDPSYGTLARQYATKRRTLEDFVKLIQYKGSMEDITDKALRTGEVAQRILGNASDRPQTVIDGLIEMAQSVGYEGLDDPYDLIRFADELEKEFGTTQTRGLGGQVQSAAEGALSRFGMVGKTIETVGQLGAPGGMEKLTALEKLLSETIPKGSARSEGAFAPTLENLKLATSRIKSDINLAYEKAHDAKAHIDALADAAAEKFGGAAVKAPLKGRPRAFEKVMTDYDGDVSRLTDIARNTVGFSDQAASKKAFASLSSDPSVSAAKYLGLGDDEMGYIGGNIKVRAPNGHVAEMQVNSRKMLFAKSEPKDFVSQFGQKAYDAIKKETGLEGGLGHTLYEKFRIGNLTDAEKNDLIAKSKEYYSHFY